MTELKRHVPRAFRGPVDGAPKMAGIIERLSFGCWNLMKNSGSRIHKLSYDGPEGMVQVVRYPDIEYVYVQSVGGYLRIILSSEQAESFAVDFTYGEGFVSLNDKIYKIEIPGIFFRDTYEYPDYDLRKETCNYIYTENHGKFIVVVNSETPKHYTVLNPREDWHKNEFMTYPDINKRQRFMTYMECVYGATETRLSFSFSPYTYADPMTHIHRYIDHAKRFYIPVYGRGEEFGLKYPHLVDCEGWPYGKKPYTMGDDGIETDQEVVKLGGLIEIPSPLEFNLLTFWPFTAYLHEIPYLNLGWLSTRYGNLPLLSSLQSMDTFKVWKMSYRRNGSEEETSLRSDSARYNQGVPYAPGNWFTSTIDLEHGIAGGNSSWGEDQESQKTYGVTRSASIGTVGNRKDLFIETELDGGETMTYRLRGEFTRGSNFPVIFYKPEFVDDMFWPCDSWSDTSSGSEEKVVTNRNRISGKQRFMLGDLLIDEGDILMDYSHSETIEIHYSGSASHSKTDCPEASDIGYTTPDMKTGDSQQFTCLNSLGEEISCTDAGCHFELTGGGGSITSDGFYTAPASNPDCGQNPTIALVCNGVTVATVKVSITDSSMDETRGVYGSCGNSSVPGWSCMTCYNCFGDMCVYVGPGCYCSYGAICSGSSSYCPGYGSICQTNYTNPNCSGMGLDWRTAADKANGCCPSDLEL